MALTKAQLVDLNANELIIDLDADTSIHADTDDQIDIKIAGADDFRFTANTFTALAGSSIVTPTLTATAATITSGAINLAALDIDGATDIGAAVVDADLFIIDDGAGGTNRKVTAARVKTYMGAEGGAFSVANLDIDGATDIGADIVDADLFIIDDGAGGTNRKTAASRLKTYIGASTAADDLTIGDAAVTLQTSSGNITIDATANDTDIIFKGTDNNADITMLTLDGSAAGDATFNNQVIVGDGKLVLNSTAVTSTAAELNLLDGVSGLVQADLTKLAAVDTTATELNIIDGNATVGTTAVADGDGIVTNDNGTMRQTTVQTFATYFGSEITAMSNLVTTGALDSGSITSGFGAIDNGTSNIRSATITAETAFVPDAANGATLGTASLEFADMYLHDGGIVYFGADQDVELAHVADVGLTLKTATTSDDTKATLTLQTGETDIAVNDVLGQLHFQAPDEAAGTDAILVAAGIAAVSEGDFSASNNATKLSFLTGASEAASEKMSLSSAGLLTIADDLVIKDGGTIGSASDADSMAIAADGVVTFSQVPVFPNNTVESADIQADAITAAKIADDAISEEHLDVTAITGHTAETTVADGDLVVIHDASASALKKMTVANLVANAGGGKVLQVLQSTLTSDISTSANSFVDTGLSLAITPSASNSKVLVSMNMNFVRKNGDNNLAFKMLRGSTGIVSDIGNFDTGDGQQITDVVNFQFLDSPNTTSETTYKIQYKSASASISSGSGRISVLNLMEIGA